MSVAALCHAQGLEGARRVLVFGERVCAVGWEGTWNDGLGTGLDAGLGTICFLVPDRFWAPSDAGIVRGTAVAIRPSDGAVALDVDGQAVCSTPSRGLVLASPARVKACASSQVHFSPAKVHSSQHPLDVHLRRLGEGHAGAEPAGPGTPPSPTSGGELDSLGLVYPVRRVRLPMLMDAPASFPQQEDVDAPASFPQQEEEQQQENVGWVVAWDIASEGFVVRLGPHCPDGDDDCDVAAVHGWGEGWALRYRICRVQDVATGAATAGLYRLRQWFVDHSGNPSKVVRVGTYLVPAPRYLAQTPLHLDRLPQGDVIDSSEQLAMLLTGSIMASSDSISSSDEWDLAVCHPILASCPRLRRGLAGGLRSRCCCLLRLASNPHVVS